MGPPNPEGLGGGSPQKGGGSSRTLGASSPCRWAEGMGAPKPVELIRGVGAPSWEPWGVGTPKSGGAVTPKPGDRALGMGAAKPGGA